MRWRPSLAQVGDFVTGLAALVFMLGIATGIGILLVIPLLWLWRWLGS